MKITLAQPNLVCYNKSMASEPNRQSVPIITASSEAAVVVGPIYWEAI